MENEVNIKHLCSVCNETFSTEEEYVAHVCSKTGHTPADPEHLIASTTPNFAAISEEALKRGEEAQTTNE